VSKKYQEFDGDDWAEGGKIHLKKVKPKDVRGLMDEGLSPKAARKENRELRKRLARRQRRIDKRNLNTELEMP
jgi:hypothetical protein